MGLAKLRDAWARAEERLRLWIYGEGLRDQEQEDLEEVHAVLAEGMDRESRAWQRVAAATGDPEAERKAREAAMEQIRLTRMVNGMRGVRSYGRTGDE